MRVEKQELYFQKPEISDCSLADEALQTVEKCQTLRNILCCSLLLEEPCPPEKEKMA